MNESSIQVTIAGRTYPLTVAEGEAKSVRDAAGRIDELVQRFQRDYGVSDRQDLIAMAALQLLSDVQRTVSTEETEPVLPTAVFEDLEAIRSLLAQAGISTEEKQGKTP